MITEQFKCSGHQSLLSTNDKQLNQEMGWSTALDAWTQWNKEQRDNKGPVKISSVVAIYGSSGESNRHADKTALPALKGKENVDGATSLNRNLTNAQSTETTPTERTLLG